MRDVVCPVGLSERLDRALPLLIEGLSRTQARKLIAAGSVFVDGRRCRVASRTVQAGTRLRLAEAPETVPVALTVLYEDDECIAIDKPEGMPSAPTRQAAAGTALEALKVQLRQRDGRAGELWLVHRLDQGTSGVLLFARTRAAARVLAAAFRQRQVKKEYLAWVAGALTPDEGVIDTPLLAQGARVVPNVHGQEARTTWRVIERAADRTLVQLEPTTGRMHQLRVHLQSIGHPVVGDRRYGGPPAARLMLHSAGLHLLHPRHGAAIEITSQAPFLVPARGGTE